MNIFFNLQFFGIILLCSGSAVAAQTPGAETTRSEPAAQGLVRYLDKLHDKLRLKPDQ